jgi:hypothetical protein
VGGIGVAVAAGVGVVGAAWAGIVGVAWGMSAGYASVFALTGTAAFVPALGWRRWGAHLGRVLVFSAWPLAGAVLADGVSVVSGNRWVDLTARGALLTAWTLPFLAVLGRLHGWGGLLEPRRSQLGPSRRPFFS